MYPTIQNTLVERGSPFFDPSIFSCNFIFIVQLVLLS